MRGRLLPPRVAQPDSFLTQEYHRQPAVSLTGANEAYARGMTGAGVRVMVVDSLISPVSELQGRIATGGFNFPSAVGVDPDFDHGTFVATVIAGARDGVGMHGVAYNASIVPVTIFNRDGNFDTGSAGFASAMRRIMDTAVTVGARVVNNSWGEDSTGRIEPSTLFQGALTSYTAAINAGVISVWAAGNENSSQPSGEALAPVAFPQLEAGWLAVMGLNSDTGLRWGTSNACGAAANWCIGAPATGIVGQVNGNDYFRGSGTSFATAVVSGALALMFQAWPNLTADQARRILFLTADDLGEPGTDPVYGRGGLNIRRVFSPVGTTTVSGSGQTMSATGFSTVGGALGDAPMRGVKSRTVEVVDAFARDFHVPAGAFIGGLDGRHRLDRFADGLRDLGGPVRGRFLTGLPGPAQSAMGEVRYTPAIDGRLVAEAGISMTLPLGGGRLAIGHGRAGLGQSDLAGLTGSGGLTLPFAGAAHPFLTGLGDGMAASYGAPLGDGWSLGGTLATAPDRQGGMAAAATLGWQEDGLSLALSLGTAREEETLLGATLSGAFTGGTAVSRFASLQAGYRWEGGLRLLVEAHLGHTARGWSPGSLLEAADVTGTAFGVAVEQADVAGGTLTAALRQPLRAEAGTMSFALPGRGGVPDRFTAKAAPSGRELDLSLGWTRREADGTVLSVGLTHQVDAGHQAGEQATLVGVRYGWRF